ncbi:hypothetical protein OUZ56_028478 [Daphnia magna]|uniref:Uncharacterized protein n=1 Tax=Daphnia magna TaxID=35525 RepID=A0ABR0B3Z8_9CRUS|nr:hypothetical protein OUZ56_028478 [Daphnia magna]
MRVVSVVYNCISGSKLKLVKPKEPALFERGKKKIKDQRNDCETQGITKEKEREKRVISDVMQLLN